MDSTHTSTTPLPGSDPNPGTPRPGDRGLRYHQGLRTGRTGTWRAVAALVLFAVGAVVLNVVFTLAAVAVELARGVDVLAAGQVQLTPVLLIGTLLGLAALTPLAALIQWGVYGQRPGSLASVTGRFRWRLFARLVLVLTPVMVVYMGVFTFFSPAGRPPEQSVATTVAFVLIGVVLMPVQAAGEEVAFRGLLARIFGAWIADNRVSFVVGALVASTLFMVAHGAGDVWLNVYYFAFGLTLSIVTYYTGGLEGAIAIHAVNNTVAAVWGSLTQDMSQAFDRTAGVGGPFMLIQIAAIAVLGYLVVRIAHRQGAQRLTTPAGPAAVLG